VHNSYNIVPFHNGTTSHYHIKTKNGKFYEQYLPQNEKSKSERYQS